MKLINQINQTQAVLLIGAITPEILRANFTVSDEDFLMIEDYTMAEIKKLIHFVNLKPYNSLKRVAVVMMAEKLNLQSANALLKTLEEPPADSIIILTTLNEQKIISTIVSRCQKIRLDLTETKIVPEGYLSPEEIAKMSVAQKFKWAENMTEEDDGRVEQIITQHQVYFRRQLLEGKNVLSILRHLSWAKDLLASTISVKLLLENLTLQYSNEN